jgi:hypothetical protein
MKKEIFYFIGIALFLSSCVKQNTLKMANLAATVAPFYGLTKVTGFNFSTMIDCNTVPEPDTTVIGYNDRLLTSYVHLTSYYQLKPYLINTNFAYDSQGHLTSTEINLFHQNQDQDCDIISSVVTYLGTHIRTIAFYQRNKVLNSTITLTYENDLLTQVFNPNKESTNYIYDNNGHNIKEVHETYANGVRTGKTSVQTNSSFDSNLNLANTFPMWVYFKCYTTAQSAATPAFQRTQDNLASIMNHTPGVGNPNFFTIDQGPLMAYFHTNANMNLYPSSISGEKYVNLYSYTQLTF